MRKILIRCTGYIDRRSLELLARHDALVEKVWRERVRNNPKERARVERNNRAAQPLYVIRLQAG